MAPPAPAATPDNNKGGEFGNAWSSLKDAGKSVWKGTVSATHSLQEATIDWFYKTKTVTADGLEKGKVYVDQTVKYAADTVATGREKTGQLIQTVQERQHDVVKAIQGKAHERADAANAPPKKGEPKPTARTERGELDYVKVFLVAGLAVLAVQGVLVGVALYKNNKKDGAGKNGKKLDD